MIDVNATTGCWLWQGKPRPNGYGQIFRNGKNYRAHRYVYEQAHGAIPDGYDLHHTCEVLLCVNPTHMELLTKAEHAERHPKKGRPLTPSCGSCGLPYFICEANRASGVGCMVR